MKVLFIASYSGLMGANLSMLQLILELKKQGIKILVIIPNKGCIVEKFEQNNIDYLITPYYISLNDNSSLLGVIKGYIKFALNKYIFYPMALNKLNKKSRDFDIIHSNTTSTHLGLFLNKKTDKPHILHLREFGFEDYGLSYLFGKNKLVNYMNKYADKFIGISKLIYDHYEKMGLKNISLIYNGISVNRITKLNITNNNIVIMCLGVIAPKKNQFQIVRAMPEIIKSNPDKNIHLSLIGPHGDNKYIEEIRNYISINKLEENVEFCGIKEKPFNLYNSQCIGIVPSIKEAFGRVTIEFMLNRYPVIATNTGANLELISHDQTGLLYDINDDQSLVNCVNMLLKNPQKIETLTDSAYKLAINNFTSEINAKKILELYNNLLKSTNKNN